MLYLDETTRFIPALINGTLKLINKTSFDPVQFRPDFFRFFSILIPFKIALLGVLALAVFFN